MLTQIPVCKAEQLDSKESKQEFDSIEKESKGANNIRFYRPTDKQYQENFMIVHFPNGKIMV